MSKLVGQAMLEKGDSRRENAAAHLGLFQLGLPKYPWADGDALPRSSVTSARLFRLNTTARALRRGRSGFSLCLPNRCPAMKLLN